MNKEKIQPVGAGESARPDADALRASARGRARARDEVLPPLDLVDLAALHGLDVLTGGTIGQHHDATSNESRLSDALTEKVAAAAARIARAKQPVALHEHSSESCDGSSVIGAEPLSEEACLTADQCSSFATSLLVVLASTTAPATELDQQFLLWHQGTNWRREWRGREEGSLSLVESRNCAADFEEVQARSDARRSICDLWLRDLFVGFDEAVEKPSSEYHPETHPGLASGRNGTRNKRRLVVSHGSSDRLLDRICSELIAGLATLASRSSRIRFLSGAKTLDVGPLMLLMHVKSSISTLSDLALGVSTRTAREEDIGGVVFSIGRGAALPHAGSGMNGVEVVGSERRPVPPQRIPSRRDEARITWLGSHDQCLLMGGAMDDVHSCSLEEAAPRGAATTRVNWRFKSDDCVVGLLGDAGVDAGIAVLDGSCVFAPIAISVVHGHSRESPCWSVVLPSEFIDPSNEFKAALDDLDRIGYLRPSR